MSRQQSYSSDGIGFTGLLAILFIALKLTHVIAWSWWWVLAPIWGTAIISLPVWIAVGVYMWRHR